MKAPFDDFDISDFWEPSNSENKFYIEVPPNAEQIVEIERTLDFKLPVSYLKLSQSQNGGIPKKTNHKTSSPTSWAEDHIAITGIFSIGENVPYSLCGEMGSQFMIDQWGYPAIGIYFADCPSGGHDMVCLDYRQCGKNGEPQVVHVDQEFDYKITFVAVNFEAFIRGLEPDDAFEN